LIDHKILEKALQELETTTTWANTIIALADSKLAVGLVTALATIIGVWLAHMSTAKREDKALKRGKLEEILRLNYAIYCSRERMISYDGSHEVEPLQYQSELMVLTKAYFRKDLLQQVSNIYPALISINGFARKGGDVPVTAKNRLKNELNTVEDTVERLFKELDHPTYWYSKQLKSINLKKMLSTRSE